MAKIELRELVSEDRQRHFEFQQDPEANHMAAFTAEDPTDETAHRRWWDMIMGSTEILKFAVLYDGELVGSIMSFTMDSRLEVTYWINKEYWGRGIASKALDLLLYRNQLRPIYARAATDNLASLRVLEKSGFIQCAKEKGFANARGKEIEEFILCKEDQ